MDTQTEISPQLLTTKLYDAALKGDIPSLHSLIRDDPFILEKSSHFKQSPLHVAAKLGHSEFVSEILSLKPELAEELEQSKKWSPLHVASAKGHLEIVNALVQVNPNMCFTRDQDGWNPVHVAAVNGRVTVIEVLLRAKPQAGRERTNCGDSVLHLCVKHGCLEALELLVRTMGDGQLLNSKDCDGNTVLHLAVVAKHFEIIKFLSMDKRMEKNAINTNGLTAMDTYNQSRKDADDGGIWLTLRHAKVLKAKDLLKPKKNQS
ncbi:Ankyrin repeat-containing protein BDA1 [Bienertia sinuspersici]